MNVVFMGTPEFACPALESLFASRHKVLAVVTGPDKPAGRGRKIIPCRAKATAMSLSLPVYQPETLRDENFITTIAELNADIFVVVAFRILPKKLYTLPPRGSINVHASLLPQYRGAAPINHAILNGETETGLTSFSLSKKVDQGEIIHQVKTPIGSDETFSELSDRLATLSGPFLIETLDLIEKPGFESQKQDDSLASLAPKIKPEDVLIDWQQNDNRVHNHIRAFSERPGAFTFLNRNLIKILRTKRVDDLNHTLDPGELQVDKKNLFVGTSGKPLKIITLQMEGKRVMDTQAFLNGCRIASGDRFESHPKGVSKD